MGMDALYSSGNAGITAACLPPRGLEDNEKTFAYQRRNIINLPSFNEVLPHVITKTSRIGKLLDQMFNGILSKTEKIGTRNRVRMLTITDCICLFHNIRPCSCCSTGDDRLVSPVGWNDLEFWSITTIKDRTVINDFNPRVNCGQISSVKNKKCERSKGDKTEQMIAYTSSLHNQQGRYIVLCENAPAYIPHRDL